MEEQLSDPPEGVRRSLRRPSFSGFGFQPDFDDGPIGQISRAGWELIQWRDFEGEWRREPFDRRSRIDALIVQLTDFVQLLANPSNPYDNLFYDSRPARRLCDDLHRTESVVVRDYDRLEAALIELGRNRDFKNARKGSTRNYRKDVLREDVWQARRTDGRARGVRARCQCRSGRALASGAFSLRLRIRGGEEQGGRARFSRPAAQGEKSDSRRRGGQAELSGPVPENLR